MDYKAIPFEQRIKENIRSYEINNLYALDTLTEYCKALCAVTDNDDSAYGAARGKDHIGGRICRL